LRLAGSNTIGAELVPRLLEAYAKKLGSQEFEWRGEGEDRSLVARGGGEFIADVSSHGSGTAPTQLAAGKADIGMMSRPINEKEVAQLAAIGFGKADAPGQEHVVALDGLVVLVNKANPVTRLSLADIQGLFSGAISDWSQVGGKPGPVHVYARDDKSGTYDTFKALVLKDKKLVSSAKRYEDSKELSDDVASDENGIGFVGFAYVRNARAVAVTTECGLAFDPKEYTVKTEEYPLARRLFLYTPQQPSNRHNGPFVEYALSSTAQPIVSREGFVSLLPESSDHDYVGQRIQQAAQNQDDTEEAARQFTRLTRAIAKAGRLSITYRFQTNSDTLDSRAARDIERLAEFVNKPENRGRRLMLAGFSDSRGSFGRNLALSRNRAQAVTAELRKRNVTPASVEGYGPVAPVACNSNDEGLAKNRRVEVWMQ
jgi:phosphate transport system substrate-binding protein